MHFTTMFEIVLLAFFAALIPEPAFAYIDPGLGSLIFQGAIAAFVTAAGAWAALRTKFREFLARFLNNRRAGENASE
ncbi:MAG TPA: hypothetical protein VNR51_05355 [Hyphomicrobium sp.]|nr:hypothetical protein [Hyphomicrobium sp.]